jgi:HB1, ASXL, restriction endonuclease HTH domain
MAASKIHQNGKPKKTPKKAAEAKKLSALDAAAQVLAETGQPMSCKEMIEAMAQKGYWSSPGGKTPASTLYSALLKEITTKGKESRFQKTDRGRFART